MGPKRDREKSERPPKKSMVTSPINSSSNPVQVNTEVEAITDTHSINLNRDINSIETIEVPSSPNNSDLQNNSLPGNSDVIQAADHGVTQVVNNQAPVSSQSRNSRMNLRVVNPRKQIFISRFAEETTEEDIIAYIKENAGKPELDVTVYKFKFADKRAISSFKITLPHDMFDLVVSDNFWPDNAVVHEYIHRGSSSGIRLMRRTSSKND